MNLTTAQLQALKVWLTANASGLNDEQSAALLNAAASPAFTVWKTSVSIGKVGDNLVGTDLAGLSTLNHTRLQTVVTLSAGGVNPSLADRRAFFDDVFSGAGGTLTRAKLLILWKRLATVGEKLFAVGTGTDVSPATLGMRVEGDATIYAEGAITIANVSEARNQP